MNIKKSSQNYFHFPKEIIDDLLDIIINSPNSENLSSVVVKSFLYQWKNNKLATRKGLNFLIVTANSLDPKKTSDFVDSLSIDLKEKLELK